MGGAPNRNGGRGGGAGDSHGWSRVSESSATITAAAYRGTDAGRDGEKVGEQPQRGRAGVRVARPRVAGALSATAVLALGRARLPDAAGLAALLGCDQG